MVQLDTLFTIIFILYFRDIYDGSAREGIFGIFQLREDHSLRGTTSDANIRKRYTDGLPIFRYEYDASIILEGLCEGECSDDMTSLLCRCSDLHPTSATSLLTVVFEG